MCFLENLSPQLRDGFRGIEIVVRDIGRDVEIGLVETSGHIVWVVFGDNFADFVRFGQSYRASRQGVPLAVYLGKLRGSRINCGQSFLAMYDGMALRTPYFLAS